ncbi:hypothetical protein [Pseudomonas aeruginosa]|uniref:hypothetical protein n=1 Tax=Pseudomonas aeruginosa TaxID=287 RepID=UPI00071B624A|nr:hypothetical protein [Pseudomonas aeruginosa]KSC58723.1 hypothetical protein AO887_10495 [Pseudomonas aeruginosa]MDP5489726.1 hypothetical protein [Pseudomonas aeruginosa]MDV7939340.1 hypothetical protein [Pseudomonas aeruginosa]HEC1605875.1 hypothetical protein [Pseudomonas aeruginosa]
MKKLLALMLLTAAIAGCGSEPPITVELGRNPYWGGPQIHITSKQDSVTINEVQINRGNCKANVQEHLPYTLPFGRVLKADAPSCQKVVEVSISTSEGDYDFSFDS